MCYNDYAVENEPKRKRLIALIKILQAQNVPVMAIGSQTHANLSWPSVALEDATLSDIAKLGLPIHITELDVNGSQRGQQNQSADVAETAQMNGGGNQPAVESVSEKMTRQYSDLFSVFRKHREEIKLVTFWGVTDTDSWLSQGAPLLFDGNWQPKPAFAGVIKVAQNKTTPE